MVEDARKRGSTPVRVRLSQMADAPVKGSVVQGEKFPAYDAGDFQPSGPQIPDRVIARPTRMLGGRDHGKQRVAILLVE
jgi:hypothetical protein